MLKSLFWLLCLLTVGCVPPLYGPGIGYPGDTCDQHPDMCPPQVYTVPVVRVVKMTGVSREGKINGRDAGTPAPATDTASSQDVAIVTEQNAVIGGNLHLQTVTQCRGVVNNPELFTTPANRDELVSTCKTLLAREGNGE